MMLRKNGVVSPTILVGVLVVAVIIFVGVQILLSNKTTTGVIPPSPVVSAPPIIENNNDLIIPTPKPTPIASLYPTPTATAIPSPSPTIAPTPMITPSPSPTPISTAGTETSYNINVLVLQYFPLTPDGQQLDVNQTGNINESLSYIRQRITILTSNLRSIIEQGSRYLGYKSPLSPQSLFYNILETREYDQPIPVLSTNYGGQENPDYNQILTNLNICNYVDNRGVREIWLWGYQGPSLPNEQSTINLVESKMSGPFGDISNSPMNNDLPHCNNTYRIYSFNYAKGTADAFQVWGHQLEAELTAVDTNLFRSIFQGPVYPQYEGLTGRCGSVDTPPNARNQYDWFNQSPQQSDCLDWNPDGLGQLTNISCQNWTCNNYGDNNNPELNYMIWHWQNLPGIDNTKVYQGKKLRNWWDVHGDFDNVMRNNRQLTLPMINY